MSDRQFDGSPSRRRFSEDWEPLSAAVLAGGQSRRMGTDKALLPVDAGGAPMLALVIEQLRSVAKDILIVAGERERYSEFDARVVPDILRGVGTLGGIHSAISHAMHAHCLVVACDMPFLNGAYLRELARVPRDFDVLVPRVPGESRQSSDGFVYQTLHAIYAKSCLAAIEDRVAAGQRQVIGFFPEVRVKTIDLPAVDRFGPDLRMFFNANTPETLAIASDMSRARERR